MLYLAPVKIPVLSEKAFWLLAILLHLLGFLQALHTGSIYLVDSIDYLSQAYNMVHHNSLYAAPWDGPLKPDYYSFRPPVYGLFIACIKFVSASDYSILLLQSLISLSTLWGVLRFCRLLNLEEGPLHFLLFITLLLYPSQIIHCNFVMSDILFQSLLFWSFYYTYRFMHQPSYQYSALAVLFFAVAMLTKPVAFLLGISIALILLVRTFLIKNPLVPQFRMLMFLIPFLALPWVYHQYASYNEKVTGYYHYTSVTPVFVLKYMAKYTNGQLYGEAYADSVQDEIMSRANSAQTYAQRYRLMNEEGQKIIKAHPAFFLWFNVKGWMALMIDPGRFEWAHFLNMDEGSFPGLYHVLHTQGFVNGMGSFLRKAPLLLLGILLLCLFWNLLLTYTFLRSLLHRHSNKILILLLLLFVAYIAGSTGVLGLSRYRIAIAPFLWIAFSYYLLTLRNDTSHT